MPRKRAEFVFLVAALAAIAALAVLRSSQQENQQSAPSTYDTGVHGYAALYDLLAREGSRVERFELPMGALSPNAGTLVIAGDGALDALASSPGALALLDRWVRSGGRLIVLDGAVTGAARRALGLPRAHAVREQQTAETGCAFATPLRGMHVAGTFTYTYAPACTGTRATLFLLGSSAAGIAYTRGRGTIAIAGTASVFDNIHLAQRENARAAYALLGAGPVRFDERVHGYSAGRTFWQVLPWPMRVAVIIALACALLGIAGANLPFAPPYDVRPAEERDSGAYIASLARMLERGGASREAVARISARCERALQPRAPGDERARMLLRELRTIESSPRPGPHDVVQAGRIFARVRKDYGC